MGYPTVAQFVALVGEAEARMLATPTPSTAPGYDQAKIQTALDNQSAFLDTYLAARYAVPLDPPPPVVVDAVLDLAREQLDRQGRDFVIKAADRRRAWAKDLAMGRATLGVAAGSEADPATHAPTSADVLIDAPARVFDDAGLADFLGS